jgi:hypothetical protein
MPPYEKSCSCPMAGECYRQLYSSLCCCGERDSSPRQIGAGTSKKRGAIGLSLRRELGRTLTKKADEVGTTTKKEVSRK